jgi:cytidine deaminase
MEQPEYLSTIMDAARHAAKSAYAPYSKFHVGAAILTRSGKIIVGCNVENSSFGLTICAERTAVVQAIVQNERDWQALAIVSPTGVTPCGACRQVLAEFSPQLEVWFGYLDPNRPITGPVPIDELLPGAMRFSSFEK